MTILGQFVLIQNRQQYEQACTELATEIAKQRKLKSVLGIKLPITYPCLMAVIPLPTDIRNSGEIVEATVLTSFVYPADAIRLMEACQEANPDMNMPLVAEAVTDADWGKLSAKSSYVPSPIAVLLLALVHELKAVGVLKKDKLITAVKHAEAWLHGQQKVNETAEMQDILLRFWETC